ncbi:MAG TPA: hypothetical protein VJ596_07140 [Gemmatimonadaceae bacterium]|nr:hypothetical protein [Gemmatimonadaceae bacterium]
MRLVVVIATVTMLLVAPTLGAQGNDEIPEGFRPPAGMCRIWIDGVPPGRQPAPTDCSTAIRRRPPNARVIFGDQSAQPPSRGYVPPTRSYRDEPKDTERAPRRTEEDRKPPPRREEPKRDPAPSRPPPREEPPRRDPPEAQPARESPRFQRNDPAG